MLIENTIGILVLRHINLIDIKENQDTVTLKYKMKGGRKIKAYKISKKETSLAVSNGWTKIEGMKENSLYKNTYGYDSFTSHDTESFNYVESRLNKITYKH